MRLRASGTSHEVRQQYMPMIWSQTIGRLRDEGKDAAQSIIDFMDSYYLTKDDFDSLLELGVGDIEESKIKIEASAKAAFTRAYNSQSHPMPFIKASTIGAPAAKSGGGKLKPDLEEAVDESEDDAAAGAAAEAPADDAEGELDLKKDKYISAPKKRKAPAKSATAAKKGAAKGKGKGKGKKAADDDDEVDSDDDDDAEDSERPSKAAKKGKGAAAGGKRGRAKKE